MSFFFFTPTTPDEVKSIIKSLDTSKATGPYSIPHQLLNALPTEISAILSEIFNKSFKTGKFHQGYRKQSQCGILEGKDKDERIQNWFNYFKQLLGQEPVIEDEHEVIGEIFHDLVFKTREYVWRVENSVEKIGKIGKNWNNWENWENWKNLKIFRKMMTSSKNCWGHQIKWRGKFERMIFQILF